MKKINFALISLLLLTIITFPQISVVKIEKLSVPSVEEWNAPVFSPDGEKIFFTNSDYNGIWQFDLSSKEFKQITDAKTSGYEFAVSADGKQISYRTTSYQSNSIRKQEIISQSLVDGTKETISYGEDVSTPVYLKNYLMFTVDGILKNLDNVNQGVAVLGIEYAKIALNINGKKTLLDPIKNGSYIWPNLSPDKKRLVVQDANTETFICDLRGKIISKIGRRNAAKWTRDGKYFSFMNDVDDGHNISSSDICLITSNGKKIFNLTNTKNIIELYPSPSPVDNLIVCSTVNGDLFLIRYKESVK